MNKAVRVLFFASALSTFGAATQLHLWAADPQAINAGWDNLKTLRPGQRIRLVLNDAKSYQGELQSLSDNEITLRRAAGEQTLARQDILRVSRKGKKHRRRNALIGAAVGAGAGLGIGATLDRQSQNTFVPLHHWGVAVGAPLGALLGAGVGALCCPPVGGMTSIAPTDGPARSPHPGEAVK
jgi:hypothetical protein